jgi:hypothetical protein
MISLLFLSLGWALFIAPIAGDLLIAQNALVSSDAVDIAVLPNGNLVATWFSTKGFNVNPCASIFAPNATLITTPFLVTHQNIGSFANVGGIRVVALNGTVLFVWSANSNIYSRSFAENGTPLTTETLIRHSRSSNMSPVRLLVLRSGNVFVSWVIESVISSIGPPSTTFQLWGTTVSPLGLTVTPPYCYLT